ncbi:MAG: putative glutamate synthase (NADPH) small subunit [Bacteroidetes bacterium ADurb.Bin234]|nr:MAG: putative glutamate synthase (NADPH) small subunit [Bacteroidetes bacterium ADurb.Bin234]
MYEIKNHPILDIPESEIVEFLFEGKKVCGKKGYTIAAALHQAGFPIHSHSIQDRQRSLECGIGKCGACEMLVDGEIRRICITKVDGVKEVREIPKDYQPTYSENRQKEIKIYKTTVAIIGAGPAGLACRETLNELHIPNLVIDNNAVIGGQFNMQTHQFFFFEKVKKYGGMRGFEIAKTLAGDNHDGILLNQTVWDILEDKRIAIKNIENQEIAYVDAEYLVVGSGAIPFMPTFENDDLPGVYTAAVFQKMMNQEHTLLGKKVLTVGAGNIGYLTSYQGMQAGASIKAIIEAMPGEGGFPVQANRVRRLGIPVLTSHILLKAIPNAKHDGIMAAVIAECKDFKPIPGTEKIIDDIDIINICTGLVPDDQLLVKGKEVFGIHTFGIGDAIRIGEGTSAVLRGKQAAYEVAQSIGKRFNYDDYLEISKQYIDSQQHPVRILEKPYLPSPERMQAKPFVQIDCLYGFACNPCAFACPHGAITKSSTSTVPAIDFNKCIGCMECVYQCPGLAIFGYNLAKAQLFLPIEYKAEEGAEVFLVDNNGQKLGEGVIEKILIKKNKTNVARVKATTLSGEDLIKARGFILKSNYPKPIDFKPAKEVESETYVCHCEDVSIESLLQTIGKRSFISTDELKHITRLGMGPCRGKRCIPRAKQILRGYSIEVTGDSTPRAPLSNQVTLGDLYNSKAKETFVFSANDNVKKESVDILIAGGGIAGSALFRYFAEAGKQCLLINYNRGASWRNIGGGRPTFSNPDISDIAKHNLEIFKEIQKVYNIDYKPTRYVNLVHDEATYRALDASRAWSDAYMVDRKDFQKEVSPLWNPGLTTYSHALIANDCWQATPGRTIEFVRAKGLDKGGMIMEDCQLLNVKKQGDKYYVLVQTHTKQYIEYNCNHFVNALGYNAEKFAKMLGIETGSYPVKHQAFITRRMPFLGKNGDALDMVIDRRHYKGFSAVYGQQLMKTGQIIGCASPGCDPNETRQNLKYNSKDFLEIVSEVFSEWIPNLSSIGFHAVWSGYYTEPRYIVDPENGLLIGLRGHGFMLGQYLAKLYVDKYLGNKVPSYMKDLELKGKGLSETAFK